MAHTQLNLDERRTIEKIHAELARYIPSRRKKRRSRFARRPRGRFFPPERSIH